MRRFDSILEEVRQDMGICSRIATSLGEDIIMKYVTAEVQAEAFDDFDLQLGLMLEFDTIILVGLFECLVGH
jgi:hypothetical protein